MEKEQKQEEAVKKLYTIENPIPKEVSIDNLISYIREKDKKRIEDLESELETVRTLYISAVCAIEAIDEINTDEQIEEITGDYV